MLATLFPSIQISLEHMMTMAGVWDRAPAPAQLTSMPLHAFLRHSLGPGSWLILLVCNVFMMPGGMLKLKNAFA